MSDNTLFLLGCLLFGIALAGTVVAVISTSEKPGA